MGEARHDSASTQVGARLTRRALLLAGVSSMIGASLGRLLGRTRASEAGACVLTPAQTRGPFYPSEDRADEDLDLTRVAGRAAQARGEVILVRGRVLDEDCQPIPDALVEIWQANTHGRYHHERDTSSAPEDPDFQGWGEVVTNSRGEYGFRTVLPGPYAAGHLTRTRHIHFRVARRGYRELITQMYFQGEALNAQDVLWNELALEERTRVTVAREAAASGEVSGAVSGEAAPCLCRFDITLQRVA